jgi:DedD protein
LNQHTKQRIVGTIVLLALALIFLPVIFDGEGSYQPPVTSRIPEAPVITLLPDPVPQRVVIESDPPTPITAEPFEVVDAVDATAETTDPETVASTASEPVQLETEEQSTPNASPAELHLDAQASSVTTVRPGVSGRQLQRQEAPC